MFGVKNRITGVMVAICAEERDADVITDTYAWADTCELPQAMCPNCKRVMCPDHYMIVHSQVGCDKDM